MCIRSSSVPRPIPSSRAAPPGRIRCSRRSSARPWTTRRPNGCRSKSPNSDRTVSSTPVWSGSCCKMPPWKNLESVAEHDFETLASETVYVGKIFALRADKVRMPRGNTARREVVEHYGAVAVLAMDDDDNVVLVYQYRHPLGRRLWELPAGLLDLGGEPP